MDFKKQRCSSSVMCIQNLAVAFAPDLCQRLLERTHLVETCKAKGNVIDANSSFHNKGNAAA